MIRSNGTPPVRARGTVRSKGAARELPGRTIHAVVAKQAAHRRSPGYQLFIAFTDGTYLEIYSDAPIHTTGSLDHGGVAEIKSYMSADYDVVMEAELLKSDFPAGTATPGSVRPRPGNPYHFPRDRRNGGHKPGLTH